MVFALVFTVGALFLAPQKASAYYSNGVGNGSAQAPYEVYTCAQLGQIATDTDAYYIQTARIDCAGVAPGTFPIAGNFSGSFNGQDYRIFNLDIDSPGSDNVGLFSAVSGTAIITRTSVAGDVTGRNNVGLLAGSVSDSTQLVGVTVNGTVTCEHICGGIAGIMSDDSSIERSSSRVAILGAGGTYGGLVGQVDGGSSGVVISDVEYTASIIVSTGSRDNIGGIVGLASKLTLTNAHTWGYYDGLSFVGGVVGKLQDSTVRNSLSLARNMNPGGGPLFGESTSSITEDNYYDTQLTGYAALDDTYGSTGIEDSNDYKQAGAAVYATWDFDDIWFPPNPNSGDGTPTLKPLVKQTMTCETPQSTETTIAYSCSTMPASDPWYILLWDIRYREKGTNDWLPEYSFDTNPAGVITGLQPDTLYDLELRYYNSAGISDWYVLSPPKTSSVPGVSNPISPSEAGITITPNAAAITNPISSTSSFINKLVSLTVPVPQTTTTTNIPVDESESARIASVPPQDGAVTDTTSAPTTVGRTTRSMASTYARWIVVIVMIGILLWRVIAHTAHRRSSKK
jgi:hypothetical protein